MLQSDLAELQYPIRHISAMGVGRLQNSDFSLLFLSFEGIFGNQWVIKPWKSFIDGNFSKGSATITQ